MPERTCSAIRADVKNPSAKTTSRKLGTAFIGGISAGITWYQRKICTSSGILRNSSTQALPKRTHQGLSGSVRNMPMMKPATSAISSASRDTDTVQPQADIIHCR